MQGDVRERQNSYRQLIGGKNDDFDDSDSDTLETVPGIRSLRGRRLRLHKCLVITLVLIVLGIVILALSLTVGKMTHGTLPAVIFSGGERNLGQNVTNTTCGLVEGVENDGVIVFKGIPYAAPPTGSRRWQAPLRLGEVGGCWGNDTYKAVEFGKKCAQWNPAENKVEGSEDCLYLNVWTPSLDTESKLPVMFYIHGGSLVARSGGEPEDAPTVELVKSMKSEMVFVSINYRLNAFGFLALKALTDASPNKASGNYGFMDQIAALNWVKDNIEQFGGDPNRVTIYGQSSGGTSVFVLLASPLAVGLFTNAWALSGSANFVNSSLERAEKNNEVFVNKTKCEKSLELLTCLKNLTTEDVMAGIPWDEFPRWNPVEINNLPLKSENYGNLAIVDGYVLEKEPVEVWKSGKKRDDIYVLLGSTAQETDYYVNPSTVRSWNQSTYEAYVHSRLDSFGGNISAEAISLYHQSDDPTVNITAEYQFTTMATDIRVTCPTNELGKALTKLTEEVTRYVAVSIPSQPIELIPTEPARYAFHAWDILAFTGTINHYIKPPSEADNQFSLTMREVIGQWVKEKLTWDYNFPDRVGKIGAELRVVTAYHEKQCEFWNSHGFYPNYAW